MKRALIICVTLTLGLFPGRLCFSQAAASPPSALAPGALAPGAPSLTEAPPVFGVEVEPAIVRLPPDIRAESARMSGVRVVRVLPATMAAQAGLEPGDIIYKINNHRIRSFDTVLDILVDLRPNVTSRVDYVRGRSTVTRNFTPDETYNKEMNFLCLIWARESRFAGRFDFVGLVCNTKESKTRALGSFAFLGPLVLEYHKAGPSETVTTLLFLTFKKGTPAAILF